MRLSDDSTSTDTETAVESSTSEEMLNQGVMAVFQDSDPACNSELLSRIAALEERFKSFQEVLIDDSAYAGSSDVTDLTSWLGQMETKIAGHNLDPSATEESDVGSEQPESQKSEKKEEKKEPVKKKEEEVEERLDEEKGIIQTIEELLAEPTEISSQMLLSAPELQATNERLKALAHNLNDQLHGLRDKVFLLDHELKRMAKGVEFALMRAKFAGVNEMVSFFKVSFFRWDKITILIITIVLYKDGKSNTNLQTCIFSSPEPRDSQGELIVYPLSRRPSVIRRPSVHHF